MFSPVAQCSERTIRYHAWCLTDGFALDPNLNSAVVPHDTGAGLLQAAAGDVSAGRW